MEENINTNEKSENTTGLLRVQVFAGNGAYPVGNAEVIITKDGKLEAFLITDENGKTPFIRLASPQKENSLDSQLFPKKTVYRARVSAEGFLTKDDIYISSVGGTSSEVTVNLIPGEED